MFSFLSAAQLSEEEQCNLGHFIHDSSSTGFLCVNFPRPMLDFALPVLGLASYPENTEEEVHRLADATADQREEEPQKRWNKHPVDCH
jgi:hypothetical protein